MNMTDSGARLEPPDLIEVSNRLFRHYTPALANGRQEIGVPIHASEEDLAQIRECVQGMLERIQVPTVIEQTAKGLVVRRKTEAD